MNEAEQMLWIAAYIATINKHETRSSVAADKAVREFRYAQDRFSVNKPKK